jgi:NADH-quinone oxidoreductase subunit J
VDAVTLFFVVAILAVASALTVILHKNPIYCALALVNTLFLIAVMFVQLDAQLVAFLQIIVYAGAIMVLFLFVLMLLGSSDEVPLEGRGGFRSVAGVAVVLLAAEATAVALGGRAQTIDPMPAGFGSTEVLAERLFTAQLLPFELTSVLLLVAVVGAVVMARRRA